MNGAVRSCYNENSTEKVLVGPVNNARDPLILTQTQLKVCFSSIQTHA